MLRNGCVRRRWLKRPLISGRIAQLSSKAKAHGSTTLQKEIYRFVLIIASLAITVATVVIIAWSAWLNKKHKGFIPVAALVINVVSVMVAMIPGEFRTHKKAA